MNEPKYLDFTCAPCSITFSSIQKYSSHLKLTHRTKFCFRCNFCFLYFQNIKERLRHENVTHSDSNTNTTESNFFCDCPKSQYVLKHYARHLQKVHDTKFCYMCKCCHLYFNSITERLTHEKAKRRERLDCKECKKSFLSFRNLDIHIKTVHEKLKLFSCEICLSAFTQLNNLKQHIISVHNKDKAYNCLQCGMKFARKHHLQNHIKTHTQEDESLVTCKFCLETFPSEQMLLKHAKIIHNESMYFVCSICSRKFRLRHTLKNHFHNMHSNLRPYLCNICQIPFKQKSHLKTHLISIHNVKETFKNNGSKLPFNNKFSPNENKLLIFNMQKENKSSQIKSNVCKKDSFCKPTEEETTNLCSADAKIIDEVHLIENKSSCSFQKINSTNDNIFTKILYKNTKPNKLDKDSSSLPPILNQKNALAVFEKVSKIFNCLYCTENFHSNVHLTDHVSQEHEKLNSFSCSLCDFKTFEPESMSYHKVIYHPKHQYQCSKCEFMHNSENYVAEHLHIVHGL